VQPGEGLRFPLGNYSIPNTLINFSTKRHWREKLKIEDTQTRLKALVAQVQHLDITSISLPALGCGNGMLNWLKLKLWIKSAFVEPPEVKAIIFDPITF
jgi:hypothetical protein